MALNAWPRLIACWPDADCRTMLVTLSAAGSWTSVVAPAAVAPRGAPLFASWPAAPALNDTFPEEVPLSVYVQLKVALPPPAMKTGAAGGGAFTAAPPVAVAAGGLGLGSTVCAAASPPFETVIETVNACPRLTAAGALAEEMVKAAGRSTVAAAVDAGVVERAAPVFASVPETVVASDIVPTSVPSSA
jgi:hypothetical protein